MIAACESAAERAAVLLHYGRKQAELVKKVAAWERGGGMDRALAAYSRLHTAPRAAAPTKIIGGGSSASGKVLWVLENLGPKTQNELAALVGFSPRTVSSSLHTLLGLECVKSEAQGSSNPRLWHFVARNPHHKEEAA